MRGARSSGWFALATVIVVAAGCASDGAQQSDDERSIAAPAESQPGTSARATSSSVAGSPAPAGSLPVEDLVVLGRDGLGVVRFGDRADEAVAAVGAVLGAPDTDSGWVEPLSIGACAGTEARVVSWGSLFLYLSDESAFGSGERHLFAYSYGSVQELDAVPARLATPEGIGLGTSVDFLRAAYEGVTVEPGEEGMIAPSFYVDDRLSGRLTGDADDDLVTVIIGGDPCGVGM
jgi:hypothetical protein